jgi:hypothetical protein
MGCALLGPQSLKKIRAPSLVVIIADPFAPLIVCQAVEGVAVCITGSSASRPSAAISIDYGKEARNRTSQGETPSSRSSLAPVSRIKVYNA